MAASFFIRLIPAAHPFRDRHRQASLSKWCPWFHSQHLPIPFFLPRDIAMSFA